ncbi:Lethal(3)malignant brain tumor-like 3, partial [Dryobates pubescens]
MEENVLEEAISIPTADPELVNALEWKDGIGTLPGSDLQFYLNEFGLLEVITEEEAEAIRTLSTFSINAQSESFAPAAATTSSAW